MRWIFCGLVSLALLVSDGALAQSNPPVPSTGNTTAQPQANTSQDKASSTNSIQASQSAPSSIENIESPTVPEPPKTKEEKRRWYSASEWWLVIFTGLLVAVTGALALYTARLYAATVDLGRDAKQSGKDQSKKMDASILEAGKSAAAMEDVAASMKINANEIVKSVGISKAIADQQKLVSEMQLRAYISVVIGSGVVQDKEVGLRFEAKPLMINSGQTPAHKLVAMIKAGILPHPLPDDYELVLPPEIEGVKENMLPPQQNRIMSAIVEHQVPEDEIKMIVRAEKQSLYTWGYITYEDAFGKPRRTDFCQSLIFLPREGGKGYEIIGYYTPGRNKAT